MTTTSRMTALTGEQGIDYKSEGKGQRGGKWGKSKLGHVKILLVRENVAIISERMVFVFFWRSKRCLTFARAVSSVAQNAVDSCLLFTCQQLCDLWLAAGHLRTQTGSFPWLSFGWLVCFLSSVLTPQRVGSIGKTQSTMIPAVGQMDNQELEKVDERFYIDFCFIFLI